MAVSGLCSQTADMPRVRGLSAAVMLLRTGQAVLVRQFPYLQLVHVNHWLATYDPALKTVTMVT